MICVNWRYNNKSCSTKPVYYIAQITELALGSILKIETLSRKLSIRTSEYNQRYRFFSLSTLKWTSSLDHQPMLR